MSLKKIQCDIEGETQPRIIIASQDITIENANSVKPVTNEPASLLNFAGQSKSMESGQSPEKRGHITIQLEEFDEKTETNNLFTIPRKNNTTRNVATQYEAQDQRRQHLSENVQVITIQPKKSRETRDVAAQYEVLDEIKKQKSENVNVTNQPIVNASIQTKQSDTATQSQAQEVRNERDSYSCFDYCIHFIVRCCEDCDI